MNRSLAFAVAAAVMIPAASLAQGVFPPPPPTGAQGVFPAPPPTGSSGVFQAPGSSPASAPGGFGPAPGGGGGGFGAPQAGSGFGAPPPGADCNANFVKLRDDAAGKAKAMQEVGKEHKDRKAMCVAVTRFAVAETNVVKFLTDNQTHCGIPEQAVASAKTNHEKTIDFRDKICADAPAPKPPSLSDALGTPTLDTAKNTKTGRGTLDSLTGNPLAR
jgi:hypothetical protein